jgi:hypothetical protein
MILLLFQSCLAEYWCLRTKPVSQFGTRFRSSVLIIAYGDITCFYFHQVLWFDVWKLWIFQYIEEDIMVCSYGTSRSSTSYALLFHGRKGIEIWSRPRRSCRLALNGFQVTGIHIARKMALFSPSRRTSRIC